MRHKVTIAAAPVIVAVVAACATVRPDRLIGVASGAVSQNLCSGTFLSGLEPDDIYNQELRPEGGMSLIDWALAYRVDRAARRVTTNVFSNFESTATFHDGYGCRLEHLDATPFKPISATAHGVPPALPEIAEREPVLTGKPALARALESAFAGEEEGRPRFTRAVVVVHDGRVIAERYAPGIGVDTPLLSHSIAKSVVNALVGILVRDGALRIDQKITAPEWHPALTVDQLLRMDSGLPPDEGRGPGLAHRMWFLERDQAAFAERTPLAARPGIQWGYSNLGYAILSRLLRDAKGGTAVGVASFANNELFAPLGMRNVTIEFDGAGSPMGSNAVFASARDWARFGLLYLNDGMAGSRRILPAGWVTYSTRQTLDSGYGAGFWLNVTDTQVPLWGVPWGIPGAPRDAFMARGYLGQYIVIVPSENLVVVRLGVTHAPAGGIKGVGQLVHDVIAALD